MLAFVAESQLSYGVVRGTGTQSDHETSDIPMGRVMGMGGVRVGRVLWLVLGMLLLAPGSGY